jgi:glycosyltransferase involved in cell wall biosynthesis
MDDGISISVIIPVFKQELYLLRALTSVVPQLENGDELIVVDDGATILQPDRFGIFSHKVLWLKQQPRKGVSAARNLGASRSNASWLKFLDADDVLAPFALSLLRQSAKQVPNLTSLISGGCHRIHNGTYLDYIHGTDTTIEHIMSNSPTLPSACMIRRDIFFDVGMFDERIDFNEDWDLWLRIYEKYGDKAFLFVAYPVCYYWIDVQERGAKQRTARVDGLPIEKYLNLRYGAKV